MNRQWLISVLALAMLTMIARFPAPGQALKPYDPPKTPWGDPDLQGLWPNTNLNFSGSLQRDTKLGERAAFTDEELAQREAQAAARAQADQEEFLNPDANVGVGPPSYWVERGKPVRQTSWVVDPPDGRIPALTEEAERLAAKRDAKFHESFAVPRKVHGSNLSWIDDVLALVEPAEHNLYVRCISRGVIGSLTPSGYNNGIRIVQAPGYVVIQYEMIHESRVIPVAGGSHVGSSVRSYMWDARGHWEGNTLVVETANFLGDRNGALGNGGGTPHSDALVLTERFTRVSDDEIQYEGIINDPRTWIRPWKIAMPLTRDSDYLMVEYACHEGNYALRGILSGAAGDIQAAEKPSQ